MCKLPGLDTALRVVDRSFGQEGGHEDQGADQGAAQREQEQAAHAGRAGMVREGE